MILMDRAPLHRRILTAPIRWHNRFAAWLEEEDLRPHIFKADIASQKVAVAIPIVLIVLIVTHAIAHHFKAH